jgi:hypothetical protein
MMGVFAHMYYHSFILGRERGLSTESILHMAIQGLGPGDLCELHRRLGNHVARMREDVREWQQ